MKIYVASSWRNDYQPEVVTRLRALGHDVYDFKDSEGFGWREVDPNWLSWNPREYILGLQHRCANRGYNRDMKALTESDICIAVMPFGPSASMEMGWAVGQRKPTCVYVPALREPDLMVKMADLVTYAWEDVESWLNGQEATRSVCQWCLEGNGRIPSSVSDAFVHHTSIGRVVCADPRTSTAL